MMVRMPPSASVLCWIVSKIERKERIMAEIHMLSIDLAKRSSQVCGTDGGGACVVLVAPIMDREPACVGSNWMIKKRRGL